MLTRRHFTILLFAIATTAVPAVPAGAIVTVDVSFPSFDNFILEGTLYLPLESSGADSLPFDPSPGVVLIHGSGPQSRDGYLNSQVGMTFPSIPAFVEIATELQQLGIAVLTYDKRSCGTFNNCYNNSYPVPEIDSIDVFLLDAQSALEYLKSREEVDSDRLVPIGHSQSGSFVPILLRDGPDGIVGGVVLEGPFSPVDQLMEYQLNYTLQLVEDVYGLNATEAMQIPQVAGLVKLVEGAASIRDGTSDEAVGGASSSFWRSWFQLSDDARSAAAVVEQPLLILNGENDSNVPVTEAHSWEEHLAESGTDEHQVQILDCVTHALNCLSESNLTLLDPTTDVGTEVDQKVHDALADFVLGVTSTSGEDSDENKKEANIDAGTDDEGSEAASSARCIRSTLWGHTCIFICACIFLPVLLH